MQIEALDVIFGMFIPLFLLILFGVGYYGVYEIREEVMKYPKISKEQAIEQLRKASKRKDIEGAHVEADLILLDLIGDEEVRVAYKQIVKAYSLGGGSGN